MLFVGLNLGLAVKANRVQSTRSAKQAIFIYALWVISMGTNLVLLACLSVEWDQSDTTVMLSLAGGAAAICWFARRRRLKIYDPMIRGWLALLCKAMPQIAQAWKIYLNRGAPGLAPVMVWTGHVTILIRLGHLWLSIREVGWDQNRRASFVSEVGNELSWIVATAV